MTWPLLAALLLQASFTPIPRTAIQNPAAVSPIAPKIRKDYDKLWQLFRGGQDDAKVVKDADKILKKNPDAAALLIVEAYTDLYARRLSDAEAKLERVLTIDFGNTIALSYLADLAFSREDYDRATDWYTRLLTVDPSRTDAQARREKSRILATENLIRSASVAEQANRLSEAESLYAQALTVAPHEPSLHERLGNLLVTEKKWSEALQEYQRASDYGGSSDDVDRHIAECLANLGRTEDARVIVDRLKNSGARDEALEAKLNELEDIGRWNGKIGVFKSIQNTAALTKAQLAALILRYFPQVEQVRRIPQVATDIEGSWALSEIQAVIGTGLVEVLPNHTFQPEAAVTRGELAQAIARLIRLLSVPQQDQPPIPITDVDSTNARYGGVQLVVSLGVMSLDDAGRFNSNDNVAGEQAIHAMTRVLELTRGD